MLVVELGGPTMMVRIAGKENEAGVSAAICAANMAERR